MNNEGNMILSKEQNTVIDLKEMESYTLPDKELKIIALQKLSELQENTERQQYMNPGKQYMNKMVSSTKKQTPLKKNQIEILD